MEVFSATDESHIRRELGRESVRFPSVRELTVSDSTAEFIRSCPNVESVTAPGRLCFGGAEVLRSYGMELTKLKRIVGVDESCVRLGGFNVFSII